MNANTVSTKRISQNPNKLNPYQTVWTLVDPYKFTLILNLPLLLLLKTG